MPIITHYNYEDQNNEIYCCLRNRIVELNQLQTEQFCKGCKMHVGDAGGKGVACAWKDIREVSNPHIVTHPYTEFASNQIRQVRWAGKSLLSYISL
jgi:hypothetical protein